MNALLFKRHGISGGACLCLLIGAATGAQAAKDPDGTLCVSTKVCPRMSCLGLLGTTRRPEVVSAMAGRSLDLPRNGHFVPSGAS